MSLEEKTIRTIRSWRQRPRAPHRAGRFPAIFGPIAAGTSAVFSTTSPTDGHARRPGEQQIIFRLLGGLSGTQWATRPIPTVVVAAAIVVLLARTRRLNVLVLGDDACAALGIHAGRLRWQLLVLTTLLTGTVVAVSGGIGFVGLIIGHLARMTVGADHRRALPVTVLLGAIFLVWSDVLARLVIAPAELPIGVVTAFLGVPVFLFVMRARGQRLEAAT